MLLEEKTNNKIESKFKFFLNVALFIHRKETGQSEFKLLVVSSKDPKDTPMYSSLQSKAPSLSRTISGGMNSTKTPSEPFRSLAVTLIPLSKKYSLSPSLQSRSFLSLSLDAFPHSTTQMKNGVRFELRSGLIMLDEGNTEIQASELQSIYYFDVKNYNLEIKDWPNPVSSEERYSNQDWPDSFPSEERYSNQANFKARARMIGYQMTDTESQKTNEDCFKVLLSLDMPEGKIKQTIFDLWIKISFDGSKMLKTELEGMKSTRIDTLDKIDCNFLVPKRSDSKVSTQSLTKSIVTPINIKPCARSLDTDDYFYSLMVNNKRSVLIYSHPLK